MIKIMVITAASLVIGFVLALRLIDLPVRVGYLGFALMVVAAWAARAHWERRRARVGDEPGAPERVVWHGLASTAVVAGHLIGILIQPNFDMHGAAGHALAVDNWMLIAGAVVSYFVLHNPETKRDERDMAIAARASSFGYRTLVCLLVAVLLTLGFASKQWLAPFTHQLLAHVLIVVITLASMAQFAAQLFGYWQDSRPASSRRDDVAIER